MAYALDSNILLRAVEKNSPDRPLALSAIKKLLERDERVVLFPQIIVEFWVVATRPTEARGGLGFSPEEAEQLLRELPALELCPESDRIFPEWERLVKVHRVRGTRAHDARIVAAMNVHEVSHILTFHSGDFQGLGGVTPVEPLVL